MLARQLLLGRRKLSVAKALEHLVGLQAQVPQNPYVALWTRLAGFRPEQLSRLIETRRAVRIVARPAAPDRLVLRYLAAFGPACVRDAQLWSGLTGLQDVFGRLRKRLRSFRDERGTELFDLPRAPRPHPDTPAPPRFLPEYDNVLLSHADRTRIVGEGDRKRVGWKTSFGLVLVDGFLRGAWRIKRAGSRASLQIQPVTRWSQPEQRAVAAEGERLLGFVAADATGRDIEIREE